MRLLHDLAKTHASFDDPNLVSRAGLVPIMALAQRWRAGGPGRRSCQDRPPGASRWQVSGANPSK